MASKISAKKLSLWVFTCAMILLQTEATLKTVFLEEVCWGSHRIDLRDDLSGVLVSVPPTVRGNQRFECNLTLVPGPDSSVAIAIFRYDVPPEDLLTIEDSDGHTISLLGKGVFQDERKSVLSNGRAVLRYKRAFRDPEEMVGHERPGFQFTYTRLKNSPCFDDEFLCKNGKCLVKHLLCDGHNHCGDNSNQLKCVPGTSEDNVASQESRIRSSPNVAIILITTVTGAVFLAVIIAVIVVYVRRRRRLGQEKEPKNQTQAVPLESAPDIAAAHPTTQHGQEDHERPSFAARVRRSLRGQRTTEEHRQTAAAQELHQVPSMYPALPHTWRQGATNPDFQGEE